MSEQKHHIEALLQRISVLERENALLKQGIKNYNVKGKTVSAPEEYKALFDHAQKIVGEYFRGIDINPTKGTITINEQRYVLVRASALSIDFFQKIKDLYADKGDAEAINIGRNFLFDIAHVIGQQDAQNFHKAMNLKNPVEKLSAGPVHFAYSGWAYVDITSDSHPVPDDDFIIRYSHPFSFEADSWVKAGKKADFPVCIMNSGYSSGWCEASFGVPLTAVELTCRAKGDKECTFIMAPPHRIGEYLPKDSEENQSSVYTVPLFFERKQAEEKIRTALHEKEVLLKEIHHRVKNNLQIISSLLKLQSAYIDHPDIGKVISESQNRIKTMAIVHEKLYQSNLGWVDLGDYIKTVAESTRKSISETENQIEIGFSFPEKPITLKIDQAIPIGLIVNEVLTNAIKYAFKGKTKGEIRIKAERMNNSVEFEISDNGVGLPTGFNFLAANTFGIELIRLLTEQLDGNMDLRSQNGTHYYFSLPLENVSD